MALQTSGPITLGDVYTELTGDPIQPNTTLEDCSNGTVAVINTNSPNQPNTSPPYSLKSWYGYDHSASGPSNPPVAGLSASNEGDITNPYTDTNITLTDTSTGNTQRAWSITGSSYTVVSGTVGNYATGQGGTSTLVVKLSGANATTYTISIKAYNADGTDTASTTKTTLSYLLELYGSNCKQYFALRKVNTGINNCIKVRRSNDGQLQDIGFTPSGYLDYSALGAFVGGNSAYIHTWYDQSGNGWDLSQTVTTQQPRIVASGVIESDSLSNKAIRFISASNNRMGGSAGAGTMGLSGSQNRTDYLVACEITEPYNGSTRNMACSAGSGYGNGYLWRITQEPAMRVYGGSILWSSSKQNFAKTSVQLGVVKLDGSNVVNTSFYYNGSSTAQGVVSSSAQTMNIQTTANTRLGNDYIGTSYHNGYTMEYAVFAEAHSDTTRGAIENNILAHFN